MPAGLRQQTFARIDQQDRGIGVRRGRHHVAGVLLVTWRVREQDTPSRRRHMTISDVDGDALFSFGRQPIDQKRQVEAFGAAEAASALSLQNRELVVRHGTRVVQQTAEQSALAVVDTAAGHDAERRRTQK